MDKDEKKGLPGPEKEPVRSADIQNAHAAGDGALERSEENDLKKEETSSPQPETPY